MREVDPSALTVDLEESDEERAEASAPPPEVEPAADPSEPGFLEAHRAALLERQGVSATELEEAILGGVMRRDFVIAVGYSSTAFVVSTWVLWLGYTEHHVLAALLLIGLVGLFVRQLWRNYFASRRATLRERAYEGVLERKVRFGDDGAAIYDAVFPGGRVAVPPRVYVVLVPGVRYRVHGAGSDEVAVDVVVDEETPRRLSAYR